MSGSFLSMERPPIFWNTVVVLQCAVIMAAGVGFALWWQPAPHSDWLYYWTAAGNVDAYERGGLSLWLLAIPKALEWSPVASALAINLPAAGLVCFLAYRVDASRWRLMAQMVVAYLLLITPYFGIVQLDLIAAAQLALGFWLAFDARVWMHKALRFALALVAVAFAVSTKPQYALVLWALLCMAAVVWMFVGRRGNRLSRTVYGLLLAGSLLGFATDMGMRKSSGRTEAIRTSSAVTLYGGLLVSSDSRDEGCGYWSVKAAKAAKADLRKPMLIAVRDRLSAKPPAHWASVVACKLPQIVAPPPYALYWLIESPNIRKRINASPERERIDDRYYRIIGWEKRAYRGLAALMLVTCFWTTFRLRRCRNWLVWLPTLWILAFWGVHMVFEIQGRYFLGMFLLAPLLCAALQRQRSKDVGAKPATVSG